MSTLAPSPATPLPSPATPVLPPATIEAAPTIIAALGSKEWHLVVLGDSEFAGFHYAYVDHLKRDLGIRVKAQNRWEGGLTSGQLLKRLRDDQDVRSDLSEAEVIVFGANPADHIGWRFVTNVASDTYDCSPKALAGYKADLDSITAEILALRKGKPTLIRTMEFYNPILALWKEWGTYEEYRRCWTAFNQAIQQSAAEHKIPVARVYDAFNGPNHDQDPKDKGYIGADGEHTSTAGDQAIADLFWKLGYEYQIP